VNVLSLIIEQIARFRQYFDWISILDILLVATIIYFLLSLLRSTQAINVLRGVALVIMLTFALSGVLQLRAISWLLNKISPALLFTIPVIFSQEIRRVLDQLGRATWFSPALPTPTQEYTKLADALVSASTRCSEKGYGALIVVERQNDLSDFIGTGVQMDCLVTPEVLVQIFFKDTPLHDGAVIIRGERIAAAACVLPLSTDEGITDRQLGLRHRASLGLSENSDAVVVVVSEETSAISVVHHGRMIRHLDEIRLRNILLAFFQTRAARTRQPSLLNFFQKPDSRTKIKSFNLSDDE